MCIGRFTRSKKFRFVIPFMNLLLKNKKILSAIISSTGEKAFIHGKHLEKICMLKISKNLIKNDCILLLNKNNIPLGFGEFLKSASTISKCDKKDTIIINLGDTGLYIRTL